MFHQANAHTKCRNKYAITHGGKHRDPRCSLECRSNWAKREAALLIKQLRSIAHSHWINFGNVQIEADLTLGGHLTVRKNFLQLFREWKKTDNFQAEFRGVSEIGPRRVDRLHHHYCIYSSVPITHGMMREIWEAACSPFSVIVAHGPPKKNYVAASKYMFKDTKAYRELKKWVWLFDYHTLAITWGTRGFFPQGRGTRKKLVI